MEWSTEHPHAIYDGRDILLQGAPVMVRVITDHPPTSIVLFENGTLLLNFANREHVDAFSQAFASARSTERDLCNRMLD